MNHYEMAEYAYKEIPLYQRRKGDLTIAESWEKIPLIEKDDMLKNINANIAPRYMADYLQGNLQKVHTSGSTGKCMEVLWKESHRKLSLLPLWILRKRYYGINPWDKRCYFFTAKIVEGEEVFIEQLPFGLGFSKYELDETRLKGIYQSIREYEPKWMILQPSMSLLLMRIAKKYGLQPIPSLTYIEMSGEMLSEEVRGEVKDFFKCQVANQYGCFEANSIAYECPKGHMHIMEENVYVETLNNGNLYITSLINKVMPFVRYGIGDKGNILRYYTCPCGNKSPIINILRGRDNDMIRNEDGSWLHADIFRRVVEYINAVYERAIVQYQVVQEDFHKFLIRMVLDEADETEVVNWFLSLLGNFTWKREIYFEVCENLWPDVQTGKLAWFISNMDREG